VYLLDTNIVSLFDPRRRSVLLPLSTWMERNGPSLFLSAMTIAELEAGVLKIRRRGQDKRAGELAALAAAVEANFGDRVLPMDARVARAVARIQDRIIPNVVELPDLIISATAEIHGHIVLTRNIRHFEPTGVVTIDPVVTLPPDVT
jgi:predicted nucleic acid-binding protein